MLTIALQVNFGIGLNNKLYTFHYLVRQYRLLTKKNQVLVKYGILHLETELFKP